MLRTSLQTITWGDPQHDRFRDIFALATDCGFQGLEIGYRRLSKAPVTDIRALLDETGMEVNATHIGGNLGDLGQAENERADFDAALSLTRQLDIPYLLYSGLNEPDDRELDIAIAQLNEFANRASDDGTEVLFHNHDWEFLKDARIWSRLREQASPRLGYALDLGWAAKVGANLAAVLEDLGPSVKILHFKDFASNVPGQNTSRLGDGIIEFEPAWRWLQANVDQDIWITAEQDNANDPEAACRYNAAYLNGQLARIGALP